MADQTTPLTGGGYFKNESPVVVPSFLRYATTRVITGIMLSSAVMSTLCAFLDTTYRFDCVLSAAVCWVASYHYNALTKLREEENGDTKRQEARADAIRHSDWIVTLRT